MDDNPYQPPEDCEAPRPPRATRRSSWRSLAIVLGLYAIAGLVGYRILRPYIVLIESIDASPESHVQGPRQGVEQAAEQHDRDRK